MKYARTHTHTQTKVRTSGDDLHTSLRQMMTLFGCFFNVTMGTKRYFVGERKKMLSRQKAILTRSRSSVDNRFIITFDIDDGLIILEKDHV